MADKIDPGMSKLRGELLFELQASSVILAKRALAEKRTEEQQAQVRAIFRPIKTCEKHLFACPGHICRELGPPKGSLCHTAARARVEGQAGERHATADQTSELIGRNANSMRIRINVVVFYVVPHLLVKSCETHNDITTVKQIQFHQSSKEFLRTIVEHVISSGISCSP